MRVAALMARDYPTLEWTRNDAGVSNDPAGDGMIRIGVDVGGTFTDVVTLDEASGRTAWLKVLTDEEEPATGVLGAIAASGVALEEVTHLRLGTTLGVNAVLTRTGARTGLITTAGFRDVLEIRRTHRERLFDLDERSPSRWSPGTCAWRCSSGWTPTAAW